MRSPIFVIALLAAAALGAQPAAAQGLTGTWTVTSEGGRGGTLTQVLTLTQSGSALTGTMEITGFGGRGGGRGGRGGAGGGRGGPGPLAISDGTVEGNAFRFTVTIDFQGNSITQSYRGTIDGDRISGTLEGVAGERPFTGTRGG